MIIFSDASGELGVIAVRDDTLISDIVTQSVAETWLNSGQLAQDFEDAYASWSNGSATSKRVPDDESVIEQLDIVTAPTPAPSAGSSDSKNLNAFHLPGKHDQSDHGRKGRRPRLSPGKSIKITHGLVHKKHASGTTIAISKDGSKKVTWNGKSYDLDSQDANGDWKTEKTAIKSKAYIAINEFGSDWHELAPEESDDGAPTNKTSSPSPSPASAPNPSPAPAPTKSKAPVDANGLTVGAPVDITISHLTDAKFKTGDTIAVNATLDKKVTKSSPYFAIFGKDKNGDWDLKSLLDTASAVTKINEVDSKWHDAAWTEPPAPPVKSPPGPGNKPKPVPISPPKPIPYPSPTSSGATGMYTSSQKKATQGVFAKNGVKWHTDTKKIYDAALEVSQSDPGLTMADALDIMDKSLQKKTGDPFTTKMTKFLSTKAGANYAKEKGMSAPATSTTSKPSPYVQPGSTPLVPQGLPVDTGPPRKLSRADATMMQLKMDQISPPPWNQTQKAALINYTGPAYREINKCLRGNGDCSPAVKRRIAGIKKAMKPSTQNVKLFRKTNPKTFGVESVDELDALVGKTIRDDAAISTSITEGVWGGRVHMKIDAPVGSLMAWVQPISQHKGEDEFVLAPGTEFEINSVTPYLNEDGKPTGERIMHVRIVPGSGAL